MNMRAQVPTNPAALPAQFHAHPNILRRKCACGGAGGECAECKKKQTGLQRHPVAETSHTTAPPIVHDVLRSHGQPLGAATREFMEPRFGHDFGQVRIHTDAKAAESAQAVNAMAYTVGRDVVFGAGQYQPNSAAGKQLLGHELTHVVQQRGHISADQPIRVGPSDDAYEREASQNSRNIAPGGKSVSPQPPGVSPMLVQRAPGGAPPAKPEDKHCGSAIGHPSGCEAATGDVAGEHYLFTVNCADFRPGEEERLRKDAAKFTSGGSVGIHGFASEEGGPSFNKDLSCARAVKGQGVIKDVLAQKGVKVTASLFLHGATAGNRDDRRSITIDWHPPGPDPAPTPKPATGRCFDTIDWPTFFEKEEDVCEATDIALKNSCTDYRSAKECDRLTDPASTEGCVVSGGFELLAQECGIPLNPPGKAEIRQMYKDWKQQKKGVPGKSGTGQP